MTTRQKIKQLCASLDRNVIAAERLGKKNQDEKVPAETGRADSEGTASH